MTLLLLGVGLAGLVISGDVFVRGAVALAMRLNLPTMVIGLTVVAFGTSAPELVVSLEAALGPAPGIALGNIVGSNIANVLIVLGIPALIASTDCHQPFARSNMMFVIGASLLFTGFCLTGLLQFWHGAVLFSLLVAFLVISARRARTDMSLACDTEEEVKELSDGMTTPRMIAFLLIGLIGMPLAAHITIDSAIDLARTWGVSEAAIGLTIIALGTSLPELVTTVAAAYRGQCGLALGNVLGSNLFNILAICGLTAMVTDVPVPPVLQRVDLWVMLAATFAIAPFIIYRLKINWAAGLVLVACYFTYIGSVYAPRVLGAGAVVAGTSAGEVGASSSDPERPQSDVAEAEGANGPARQSDPSAGAFRATFSRGDMAGAANQ